MPMQQYQIRLKPLNGIFGMRSDKLTLPQPNLPLMEMRDEDSVAGYAGTREGELSHDVGTCAWRIVISQATEHVTMLHSLAGCCSFQRGS